MAFASLILKKTNSPTLTESHKLFIISTYPNTKSELPTGNISPPGLFANVHKIYGAFRIIFGVGILFY